MGFEDESGSPVGVWQWRLQVNHRFVGCIYTRTDMLGSNLITVDAASGERSYAGNAYLQPNFSRPNLTVLTQAMVSKITFARRGGQIFASGVEFSSSGSNYHVKADNEVLLCCGSIQSPQVLELSGVGSKEILEPLGIDVIVENANVGENFQDHGIVPLSFQAAEGVTTFDSLITVAGAEAAATNEFFATQTGLLSSLIDSNANLSFQQVDQRTGHVSTESISKLTKAAVIDAAPNLKQQYKLLGEALLNPKDSAYQMIYIPIGIQKGFADGEGTPSPGSFISLYTSISRPYVAVCISRPKTQPLLLLSIRTTSPTPSMQRFSAMGSSLCKNLLRENHSPPFSKTAVKPSIPASNT